MGEFTLTTHVLLKSEPFDKIIGWKQFTKRKALVKLLPSSDWRRYISCNNIMVNSREIRLLVSRRFYQSRRWRVASLALVGFAECLRPGANFV